MSNAGKWGYEANDELYLGAFETAEEAASEGASKWGDTVTVGQYRDPEAPETFFDADSYFEDVFCHEDYAFDFCDGWPGFTNEQNQELESAVSKVIGKWLDKHGLRPDWCVVDQTTVQKIRVGSQ